ncbi:hypothetical protein BDA96_01G000800 [Sorghum bicolor]|uniref:SLH domain-containing protein n=2 Tax=Sorghum bicolor TaxID=4558 RepID=A0A921RVL6_SORBI|nr:uncharacterized protein LOC8059227 [Sorghum bicolor]EER93049.1 hypothetical protein SORBI_3001G000800 [Sorghum bicolor]KAG0546514.1 hypothetical protein BDA96_01G000800 [Sorghum bicolor]|eukprot:XP_002466051.1 uncharacterized protein LOC8059227 [Sorghum bicolor]
MPAPVAAYPAKMACCLQLHLLRRSAPAPLPARVLLLLSTPRLRLRPVRASPGPGSSPPNSFAGWSSDSADDGADKSTLGFGPAGGLLGPGLAAFFFLAGLTFAAVSIRSSGNHAAAKMQNLPAETAATESYSDYHSHKEDDAISVREEDAQASLPTDWEENNDSLDETKSTDEFLAPLLQSNEEVPGVQAEHEVGHPLQNTEPVTNGNHLVGEEVQQFDNLIASDGNQNPASPPLPISSEYAQVSFAPSSTLDAADPSEGIPNVEETSDLKMALPENEHLDETLTSDAMVLDSDGVVLIQDIADSAVAAAFHPEDKGVEQNPQTHDKDEFSPSGLPDYMEHVSAEEMHPLGSNELSMATGTSEPGDGEETIVEDLYERESELENQNKPFKSTPPDQYFSSPGIPAPSIVSTASQVPVGQIVVPASVDPTQENAIAALQILKVIEPSARAGDLCTRREYARWLVVASNCLSRNTFSKVYPAMYIDNVTELAFDDVTPEDPDFPFIQGLAEAGLISSKLSRSDMNIPEDVHDNHILFSPESPLSRQDLVSWKMVLDRRQLPEVDRNCLFKVSGYIDIDKINTAAWPALVADLGAGDQSITALSFGFTRLFQPNKPVTKGQAALAISTGDSGEVVLEEVARIEAEKIAEAAVNAHGALVAQVEKDLNARFERELKEEREKVETLEKLAEEARMELDRLREEREEEKNILLRGRAAVESEMEVLLKLRSEVEEQLQNVLSKKVEVSFEKSRIEKLQKEIENDNLAVVQLQYELEVERKALSLARAWAEEEAKKAREHARALEDARNQWERQGIKVVVEGGLQDDASAGVTWANAGKEHPVDEVINRAESLLEKLKSMSAEMKVRSRGALERVMQHVRSFIASLKQQAADARQWCSEFGASAASKALMVSAEVQGSVSAFGATLGDKSKRVMEECKDGLEKFSHRFKTSD